MSPPHSQTICSQSPIFLFFIISSGARGPAGRNIFLPARAPCGFAAFCAALVVATGRIKQMCAALYKAGFATLLVLRRLQVFIGRCIIYNIVKYEGIF